MKEFWNERYGKAEFAYGVEANEYLKMQLAKLPLGKILFVAEGEGRNAVYAATLGWDVHAFDISEEGKNKAERLAKKNEVSILYTVIENTQLPYHHEEFDAIVLIYSHYPSSIRNKYHPQFVSFLKKGGYIIMEAFSKNHIQYNANNPAVGGPKELDLLYSKEEMKADFGDFEIIELEETVVELNEGLYHNGTGSVIRFLAKKK
ncbi:MAG: class I SAM-dependent methyltransferase [Bacteroidia bacterium]|nr:class I SAM-dependent methyltransferase [Bacteroidia bacterium]